jgi:hypothetical protein
MPPSNQDGFNGYRTWLGISESKLAPIHYELLGMNIDEDDPEVIRAAVTQRKAFIESRRGSSNEPCVQIPLAGSL